MSITCLALGALLRLPADSNRGPHDQESMVLSTEPQHLLKLLLRCFDLIGVNHQCMPSLRKNSSNVNTIDVLSYAAN